MAMSDMEMEHRIQESKKKHTQILTRITEINIQHLRNKY